MAGNIEKGEASTPLGERLKIRLDENLDVLFAGMDLDTDSLVAEVDVVASPVLSSSDGIRHWGLACGIGGDIGHRRPLPPENCLKVARSTGSERAALTQGSSGESVTGRG